MLTVAQIAERLSMPERMVREWADRLALPATTDEAGIPRYAPADAKALEIVRDVLECPYASSALALYAAEASRGADYPETVFPPEFERLRAHTMRLVDEARDLRGARQDPGAGTQAPATGAPRRLLDALLARLRGR